MKRKWISLWLVFALGFAFTGCSLADIFKESANESSLSASEDNVEYEVMRSDDGLLIGLHVIKTDREYTVKEAMDIAVQKGVFTYELSNGMVTSIDGRANTANSYWMLYTSDAEFSNAEWGTITYEGMTLGSAVLGAETLPVTQGAYYAWSYQTFAF